MAVENSRMPRVLKKAHAVLHWRWEVVLNPERNTNEIHVYTMIHSVIILTSPVPLWFTNGDLRWAVSFPAGATPRWSEKFDVVFGHSTKVASDSTLCSLRLSGLSKPQGSFAKLVYWSRLL